MYASHSQTADELMPQTVEIENMPVLVRVGDFGGGQIVP